MFARFNFLGYSADINASKTPALEAVDVVIPTSPAVTAVDVVRTSNFVLCTNCLIFIYCWCNFRSAATFKEEAVVSRLLRV